MMSKSIDPVGEQTLDVMQNARFYNKWLFSFFRPHLGRKIIEIGAGAGTFSKLFSKYGNFTALDINKNHINKLRKNYDAGYGNIEENKYFFKNKKFDTAVTLNVFEHINNDQKAVDNAFKLLEDGGKFLILVPAFEQAFSEIDKNLGHYRRYSIEDLEKKLKKSGFEIISSRYLNFLGLIGWFVSGKILNKKQLETNQISIFEIISKPFLFIEKMFKLNLGLSVFIVAQKPREKINYKKLSIIIPVFNEEKTLEKLIKSVKKVKLNNNLRKEIIVVDDGSTDKSVKIISKIKSVKLIKHKNNQGKGAAIKTGLENASGDIVIIQDADLEYNPKDYNKLLKPIITNKTKVVYGTRLKNLKLKVFGNDRTLHPQNYFANKFLSSLTNLLFGTDLTDMETCYKVFRSDLINPKALNSSAFEIEPELTALFAKQGEKIKEVPIKVTPRAYSEGKKIKPKDGIIAIETLFIEKFLR